MLPLHITPSCPMLNGGRWDWEITKVLDAQDMVLVLLSSGVPLRSDLPAVHKAQLLVVHQLVDQLLGVLGLLRPPHGEE